MSVDDVTEILAVDLIGTILDDEQIVVAANQGEPLSGQNSQAEEEYKNICRRLLGEDVPFAELKQSYGIKERESLRDHLTVEQLREVEHLETLVSGLIGVGMSYEQIKAFLAQWYDPQKRIA